MAGNPLLTEFWRDVVSVASAVITIVGFVLTVLSLVYAIKQIWKTQSAADAAVEAANRAVSESRDIFNRYVLPNAVRFLAEAMAYVASESWAKASLRVSDLADQVAQLVTDETEWNKKICGSLRKWSETLGGFSGSTSEFSNKKWGEFTRRLQLKIDEFHGPFKDL